MVSMLDCIKRVPVILNDIISHRNETFEELWHICGGRLETINELVLIGSGTSYTSGITARYPTEAASGLRVTVYTPVEFLHDITVRNRDALHIFISQTGTSILTGEALAFAKKEGFLTAAISESTDTPIASEAEAFIDMRCGKEEYPMRTIGYSATVMTLILLGAELGYKRNYVAIQQYESYISQAKAASAHIPALIAQTMAWLDTNRRSMLRAQGIFMAGSGALYGVALEGAVKIWETPQIIAAGYELEEGLHGPNYGYNHNHCVIVLNGGGHDSHKAAALGRYMKHEKNNGFIIGVETDDGQDLPFIPAGGCFNCLEFAAVVQTLAYRLAEEQGRDLFAPHDNRIMNGYFKSHSEEII